ncbi:hypothetical protein LTR16_010349, partial [Cryomyces antarcticus]
FGKRTLMTSIGLPKLPLEVPNLPQGFSHLQCGLLKVSLLPSILHLYGVNVKAPIHGFRFKFADYKAQLIMTFLKTPDLGLLLTKRFLGFLASLF